MAGEKEIGETNVPPAAIPHSRRLWKNRRATTTLAARLRADRSRGRESIPTATAVATTVIPRRPCGTSCDDPPLRDERDQTERFRSRRPLDSFDRSPASPSLDRRAMVPELSRGHQRGLTYAHEKRARNVRLRVSCLSARVRGQRTYRTRKRNTPTMTRTTTTTTMTRAVCATHRRAACTPTNY